MFKIGVMLYLVLSGKSSNGIPSSLPSPSTLQKICLSSYSVVFCSLENAGEGSVLTMLRSVRMVLELVAQRKSSAVLSEDVIDAQVRLIAVFLSLCPSYCSS